MKEDFPQAIRNLRKAKGLKQHELAKKIKISRSLLSHWEISGENQRHPKPSMLRKLMKALKVSPETQAYLWDLYSK